MNQQQLKEQEQKRLEGIEKYVNSRSGCKCYKIAKAMRMRDEIAQELLIQLRNEGKVMRRRSTDDQGEVIDIYYPASYAFDEGGYDRKWWRIEVSRVVQRLSGVMA